VELHRQGENRITRRWTCPSATLSITNLQWTGHGSNPWLPAEKLTTNSLFQVTVLLNDKADLSNMDTNLAPTSKKTQILPILQLMQITMEIQQNYLFF